MDLRLVFNEDVKRYDRYRPIYPAELHQEIIAYAGLRHGNKRDSTGIFRVSAAFQPFM